MDKKYHCDRCNEMQPVLVKMGGLICEKCRKILFYQGSKEWNERTGKGREKQ